MAITSEAIVYEEITIYFILKNAMLVAYFIVIYKEVYLDLYVKIVIHIVQFGPTLNLFNKF